MKYLPAALTLLVASIGFVAGHKIGATKSAAPRSNAPVAPEPWSPTTALDSASLPEKATSNPALTEAYELIRGNVDIKSKSSYEIYPAFYAAVQQLNLEEVRQLHRRVMAMPKNEGLLDTVADRLVELDPAYALDFVRKLPDSEDLKDPSGVVAAWARRTPDAAIAEATKLGDGGKASLLLKEALGALAKKDPEDALSKLGLIADEKQRDTVMGNCLTFWALRDPAASTQWLQAHPETYRVGANGNDSIAWFIRTVASRDLTMALEFSQTLPEPMRQQALMASAREWAMADPVAALAWAKEKGLPLSQRVSAHMDAIISTAMNRGPEKTTTWIESLPDGPERSVLAGSALRFAKAGMAPKLFALIPEDDQPRFVGPFMMSLNMQTSGAGRQWMLTLPEGNLRVAAMNNLIRTYWFKDPVAIIDTFPAGYSRDVGYAAHIRRTGNETKAPDVQQLSKIADKEFRQKTAVDAFVAWSRSDRAAARKWLDETPHISAEAKTRLTQPRGPTDEK